MPTPPLKETKRKRVVSLHGQGHANRVIATKAGVSTGTVANVLRAAGLTAHRYEHVKQRHRAVIDEVRKGGTFQEVGERAGMRARMAGEYAKRALPVEPVKSSVGMPEPLPLAYSPYTIDRAGHWGVIGDIHLPCHDRQTIELFVKECKRRKVVGVILNGDTLDSHEVSDHLRDPSAIRYRDEIEMGKEFLGWLRGELPNVEIVWKEGNHDDRCVRYLMARAPALEGLEGLSVREWLHFKDFGIDEVKDKRIISLGKLHVIHGHEYRGGGGVNPARWLYLRARSVAICNHFHRTSEHHERNIAMKYEAAWSLGCACYLHPAYAPINNWNLGFAFVELENDGGFSVENKRVFEGRMV